MKYTPSATRALLRHWRKDRLPAVGGLTQQEVVFLRYVGYEERQGRLAVKPVFGAYGIAYRLAKRHLLERTGPHVLPPFSTYRLTNKGRNKLLLDVASLTKFRWNMMIPDGWQT